MTNPWDRHRTYIRFTDEETEVKNLFKVTTVGPESWVFLFQNSNLFTTPLTAFLLSWYEADYKYQKRGEKAQTQLLLLVLVGGYEGFDEKDGI